MDFALLTTSERADTRARAALAATLEAIDSDAGPLEDDEDFGYCASCNGSGEGGYSGSVCMTCGGAGE